MRGCSKLVAIVALVALVALPAGASALTPSATTSIRTDAVRAKWGSCEVFSHANANPYTPAPYGPLVGAWVR